MFVYSTPIPATDGVHKLQVKVALTINGKLVTKTVKFGDRKWQDYTQHGSEIRRDNYLRRSAGIRNKEGELTKDDPFSANYWARRILWASDEPIEGVRVNGMYQPRR